MADDLAAALTELRTKALELEAAEQLEAPTPPDDEPPEAPPQEEPPNHPQLLPPPHGKRFSSREAAFSYLLWYCAAQGYEPGYTGRAKGKKGMKVTAYCKRGGRDYIDASRDGKSGYGTNKVNCPMRFTIDCLQRTDFQWELDTLGTEAHTHPPIINAFSVAQIRHIDDEGKAYML